MPRFAAETWIAAWNAHDLDAVLDHFAEGVEFSSPLVRTLVGEPSGTVRGRAALRAYWEEGLRRIPDLHFELVSSYEGVDSVCVTYTNQSGRACCEVGLLDADGRVVRGVALYGS